MSRPGRQRMEMDDLYMQEKIGCSHCSREFNHILEMDRHLEMDHGFSSEAREKIFIDMGIKWFQNYAPPGRWKGWWAE